MGLVVSRKTATIVNLIHQYVTTGLSIINGIVLVPLYLTHIDFKLYGAWLATGNIVAWLLLADAGFSDILRQRTARHYGQQDFDLLGKIITTGLICVVAVGMIPLLISMAIAPFLPHLFKLEGVMSTSLIYSFVCAGVASSLVVIAGGAGAAQQGLQRNISYSTIYNGGSIVGILVTIWMLVHGYGLLSIPMGLTIRGILWVLGSWGHLFWFCKHKLGLRMRYAKEHLQEILNLTSWTFFSRLAYQLFAKCDAFIVGLFMGPEATPVFVLTGRAWDLLLMFVERIAIAAMPSLAHLEGEGDNLKFNRISQLISRIVAYASIIGIGACLALNKTFMALWVGKKLYAGGAFDIAMSMAMACIVFVSVVYQILYARGKIKELSIAATVLCITRALSVVGLIWLVGYIGSPISFVAVFGCAIMLFYAPQWIKSMQRIHREFLAELICFARAALIAVILALLIRYYIIRENWWWFIGCGVVYIFLCGILFITIDKSFRDMALQFSKKLRARFI